MPILVDLSQLVIANVMASPDIAKQVDENLIRHMVVNSLLYIKTKFKHSGYGNIVICMDSDAGYWRKDEFPYYKFGRSESREDSWIDWKAVFSFFNQFKEDLKTQFPWVVIQLPKVEADDIIGVLAASIKNEKVLIVGSDKDYKQCLVNPNVSQFSMLTKSFVEVENPKYTLFEHIVKGDKGDGIPNIKSPEDIFKTNATAATKTRQKSVTKGDLLTWWTEYDKSGDIACSDKTIQDRFELNKKLIDFTQVPSDLRNAIKSAYVNTVPKGDKQTVMQFLVTYKMRNLLNRLTDFD